ncbi:MAG: protein-L-isoaspartate(D-aspartate) O-methyltransferase [Candidatus Omnitrophica bacterium]|nr:protein-L-isoaspartate(D-aspartate) O-methyltransferase [Candidatus Omnitrophota bacterium]
MAIVSYLCLLTLFFSSWAAGSAGEKERFVIQRKAMVERQIKGRGIQDPAVLEAMRKVERHRFVDERLKPIAYDDTTLPIGYGQTISQPYMVGFMTEAAQLKREDRVLEIGTGSGYQAAVLAEIAKEVYTVEIVEPLAAKAKERLIRMGYTNVHFKQGDGYEGWPKFAPYDAIVVTAAPPKIPEKLVEQLKVGGRMVIPVGSFDQELYRVTRTKEGVEKEPIFGVRFVPMVKQKE